MQGNQNFADKEMMHYSVISQKFLTDVSNIFTNECAPPQVRDHSSAY